MARAAAKRNKRAKQAAGSKQQRVGSSSSSSSYRRPEYESQLFFGRLRTQAKWVFAFLAVVFAVSFVFFGVGSGSGALNDLFTFNWFGGGTQDPVQKLVNKLEKDPENTTVLRDLGTTLDSRTPPRVDDAVQAYERWATLRPRSVDALNALANEYGKQAQAAGDEAAKNQTPAFLAPLALYHTAPSNTTLGQALDAQVPPEFSTTSLQQGASGQLLEKQKTAYQKRIKTYQRLAKIQPTDPGWVFQIADTTRLAGERRLAIKRYQEFIKKFPEDASASIAREYIKQLQSSTSTGTTSTSTG